MSFFFLNDTYDDGPKSRKRPRYYHVISGVKQCFNLFYRLHIVEKTKIALMFCVEIPLTHLLK